MYLPLEFCFRVAFPKPIRNPFLLTCSEVVRDGLALHKDFKGAVAAGCEIHGVASFLNLGVKKAASFSPTRRSENAASAVSYSILI